MKFATKVVRAKQLHLTLHPYQAADGRTFVRICDGDVELADVADQEVASWLAERADRRRLPETSVTTGPSLVRASESL